MSSITRYEKDLIKVEKAMADELKKEAEKKKKISSLENKSAKRNLKHL